MNGKIAPDPWQSTVDLLAKEYAIVWERNGPHRYVAPDDLLPFRFFMRKGETWDDVLRVAAPTWFVARQYAMRLLGIGPDDFQSKELERGAHVDVLLRWKGTESREVEVSR